MPFVITPRRIAGLIPCWLAAVVLLLAGCAKAPPPPPIPSPPPLLPGRPILQTAATIVSSSLPDFHTEECGVIDEPGFAAVVNKPLSTFSIDVDTASYANVRRFLHDGQLPPADAVRIEELINYFDYDYPDPSEGEPFSIVTEMAACPWAPSHRIVHIGLRSKPVAPANLPPNNLVFLIDVSGSMDHADKLPLLKKAFSLLVEQLRPQDQVSIVVYADAEGMVLPPTSGAQKTKILRTLSRLDAGGSTAGGAGIRLAYKLARENFIEGGNNRVILATDGDFNVGVSSDGQLVKMIERERESGVFLTVLGFGTGNLKDSKMEKLADHGNGNYAYIDNVLVEQMGATQLTVAKDVKLQVEFNPAQIKAYRLIGYENRRLRDEEFNDDEKAAGDLGAGHSVTALYEVIPAVSDEPLSGVDPLKYQQTTVRPDAAGGNEVLTGKVRYKPPEGSESREVLTVKLRYKPPEGSESRLLTRVLAKPGGDAVPTQAFRFAPAGAEFGLLLRDSTYKGAADYDSLIKTAKRLTAALSRIEAAIADMEFVRVPAGEFLMGSTSEEASAREQPLTRVRISRGFYLGKYEVTQAEWQAVMGSNPSVFDECGPDCPVEGVSWEDAQEFIGKLNATVGVERYRLPTEAEWEYAARAGTKTDTPAGDLDIVGRNNVPLLDGIAWYGGNSGVSYAEGYDCSDWGEKQYASSRCGTHPVGQKAPNAWGLYDMLGNVWEWVGDWYGAYPGGAVTDPRGPGSGEGRVYRGGGWIGTARVCRAPDRSASLPGDRYDGLGFRLLRTE